VLRLRSRSCGFPVSVPIIHSIFPSVFHVDPVECLYARGTGSGRGGRSRAIADGSKASRFQRGSTERRAGTLHPAKGKRSQSRGKQQGKRFREVKCGEAAAALPPNVGSFSCKASFNRPACFIQLYVIYRNICLMDRGKEREAFVRFSLQALISDNELRAAEQQRWANWQGPLGSYRRRSSPPFPLPSPQACQLRPN
jgi:hypothetical protein